MKKNKKIVDRTYLACAHHSVMIGSLGFFLTNQKTSCLLIGLGGGGLPTYISAHFDKVKLKVVEIDGAIIRVAKDQFGFNTSDRLQVVQDDGLKFIENCAKDSSGNLSTTLHYDSETFKM